MGKDNLNRPLLMLPRLLNGERINRTEWINQFQISLRTAQRDINDIQAALHNTNSPYKFISNDHMVSIERLDCLDERHVLILEKILLASRSLNETEIFPIFDNLLLTVSPDRQN